MILNLVFENLAPSEISHSLCPNIFKLKSIFYVKYINTFRIDQSNLK